ncbi:hypothetical protein KOR42_13950 [Thalassoglobus neptunius]|uniref:Uncharacterized protein n=1 Tax=Thalassoglobus neptunius TaxID=1938619 RepID=A0A5C5X4U5_9PLAN|nr:hypothetical protein KOR42_13950 [Thalassoglobus neptunius]
MRDTNDRMLQQFLPMGLWGARPIRRAVSDLRLPGVAIAADTIGQQQKVYAKTRTSNCTSKYAVHRLIVKFILNEQHFPVIAPLDPFGVIRFGPIMQRIQEFEYFLGWSSPTHTNDQDDNHVKQVNRVHR